MNIVDDLVALFKARKELSDLKDFQDANGFISIKNSGVSVGIDRERYSEGTFGEDSVTADVRVLVWVRERDQAKGEKQIRSYAKLIRKIINEEPNRNFNGQAIGSFVRSIEYMTAEASNNLLLHIAEINVEVEFYENR